MKEKIITVLLLVVALIHIAPITGFAGVLRLESLYGVVILDSNLQILMRHRAMLFGILGVFFAYAAFKPSLQPLAFIGAFATLASFFYLAISVADYNQSISKILVADVVASICLLLAVVLYFTKNEG